MGHAEVCGCFELRPLDAHHCLCALMMVKLFSIALYSGVPLYALLTHCCLGVLQGHPPVLAAPPAQGPSG
jgi:hypothetical protein